MVTKIFLSVPGVFFIVNKKYITFGIQLLLLTLILFFYSMAHLATTQTITLVIIIITNYLVINKINLSKFKKWTELQRGIYGWYYIFTVVAPFMVTAMGVTLKIAKKRDLIQSVSHPPAIAFFSVFIIVGFIFKILFDWELIYSNGLDKKLVVNWIFDVNKEKDQSSVNNIREINVYRNTNGLLFFLTPFANLSNNIIKKVLGNTIKNLTVKNAGVFKSFKISLILNSTLLLWALFILLAATVIKTFFNIDIFKK